MTLNDDSKNKLDNNEGSSYNNDYKGRNPWNTRDRKSPWVAYILVAAACLLLAYVLSSTAK